MYYSKQSSIFKEAIKSLQGKKVAVIGHLNPDGDCIGSQVALCRILIAQGIEAIMVNEDKVPQNLTSFLGDTPFCLKKDFNAKGYEAAFVDCAGKDRAGNALEQAFPNASINIDHHLSNTGYAQYDLMDPQAAATAEILAAFTFDIELEIDTVTAQALYLGIATDTGQFRFPSTSEKTFDLCNRLITNGANPSGMAHELYECERLQKLLLLRDFLGSLKMELGGKVCVGMLSQEMYRESDASKEDSEGFVDYPRSIKGVEIAILLEERPEGYKGSLRAKDPKVRVDLLAAKYNGGGHACAAGFRVNENMQKHYPQFIETVKEHLDNIS